MSKTKRTVFVRLKEGVLDTQGVTIEKALNQIGDIDNKSDKTGKFFELEIESDSTDIENQIKEVCTKLLSNPVIENYRIEEE